MKSLDLSYDKLLDKSKKFHFIGIGGSGMCPIVEILHNEGYTISGSDNNETDTLKRVRSYGIKVTLGHFAQNVEDVDVVVYSAAIFKDNPEILRAKELGIPLIERSIMLGILSRQYKNSIGVSGTHGKTTVTSMITQIFITGECDPSVVIGGKLPFMGTSGRVGHNDLFVCEACEFVDTFLQLSPTTCVILNIDDDHMDYFKTMDNVIKSFRQFSIQTANTLVVNGDDQNVLKAVDGLDRKIITFGVNKNNDYYPTNISMTNGAFAKFDVNYKGEYVTTIQLSVPGEHNIYNALSAFATTHDYGVSDDVIAKALGEFTGAGRRFEVLGKPNGIVVADDYAHHPTEIEVTLKAAMAMGYNNVWAVHQPFTYSRTKALLNEFAEVLSIADKVVLSEIMGSREVNTIGIYTKDLAEKIDGSVWFETFEEICDYVCANAKEGDLVITLGCGDVYKVAKMIIEKLENK